MNSTRTAFAKKLGWTQAVLTCIAVLATLIEVESIIWICPMIAILGLWIAILAVKRDSVELVAFGLLCPLVTSMIALLIAAFSMSPETADNFVWIVLALNAVVIVAWWNLLRRRIDTGLTDLGTTRHDSLRFSILHMLMGTAVIALTLAILRLGIGEMTVFALYGVAILVASLAILLSFAKRTKQRQGHESSTSNG